MAKARRFESKRHALAYLMGVYLSDGCVTARQGCFGLHVKDKKFRDTVAEAMRVVGGKFGQGRSKRGYYWLWERKPWCVGWRLEDVFPSGKDHLPAIPDDLARDLVAGIMDGDGCLSHLKSGQYLLVVCGCSGYLKNLQGLLAAHEVLMHYHLRSCQHTINIRSFVKAGFYFRMPRKQTLLEEYSYG